MNLHPYYIESWDAKPANVFNYLTIIYNNISIRNDTLDYSKIVLQYFSTALDVANPTINQTLLKSPALRANKINNTTTLYIQ